jgi:lactoylglutathione lyase
MASLTHIGLWTNDLQRLRQFYIHYFGGISNAKYVNSRKGFCSYFLRFEGGAALEIMQRIDITEEVQGEHIGLAHIAFSLGNKDSVNTLTEQLRADGYTISSEPRTTGDGFYEAVILDPDGNRVELVG